MSAPSNREFFPTPGQAQVVSAVLEHGHSAVVISGPGMGKSRTAIELARRHLARPMSRVNEEVLFLSFSNASIRRLAEASGVVLSKAERRRLRFMTYHSCAAELLRLYGRFVGLGPRVAVVDKLEERLLAFEGEWQGEDPLHLARTKGLLTFDVLVPLATTLLTSSPVLRAVLGRRYPLIVVDEFQDTSPEQWGMLQQLGALSQVVAFGDPNQIIYSGMNRATASRIAEFEKWKQVSVVKLTGPNHRCDSSEILSFADCLLEGKRWASASADVELFNIWRKQLRSKIALLWIKLRQKYGHNLTLGVLAAANSLVEQIATDLRSPPADVTLPISIYVQMPKDEAAHDAVLLALAALQDLARNQSSHTARRAAVALVVAREKWSKAKPKAAEVEQLATGLHGRDPMLQPLLSFMDQLKARSDLSSMIPEFCAALVALKNFQTVAKRLVAHEFRFADVQQEAGQLSLFESIRGGRAPKGLYGDDARQGRTQVLTYHKAKGREFDCVVMVVDTRAESSKSELDEQRRLYYVCATRARRWLGIVHYGEQNRVLTPVIT